LEETAPVPKFFFSTLFSLKNSNKFRKNGKTCRKLRSIVYYRQHYLLCILQIILLQTVGGKEYSTHYCHDLAKQLSYYLYFFSFSFSFLFLFELTTQERSMEKYHMIMSQVTCQDITGSYHMMMLYDKYGRVVHRLYSSCISSVQNPIGTLLSFPCQFRLRV